MENKKIPLWIYLLSVTLTTLCSSVVLVIYYKELWLCVTHIILTILAAFQIGFGFSNPPKSERTLESDNQENISVSVKKEPVADIFTWLLMLATFVGFFLSYKISIYDSIPGGVIKKLLLSIVNVIGIWCLPIIAGRRLKYWISK